MTLFRRPRFSPRCLFVALLAGLALLPTLRATSTAPWDDAAALADAEASARGTVLSVHAWRDSATGRLWTDTLLRVDEGFKGTLPTVIRLRHPGGSVGGGGEYASLSPRFAPGEERLVFLRRQPDGTLFVPHGPAGALTLRARNGRAATDATQRLRRLRSARPGAGTPGTDLRRTAADASGAGFFATAGLNLSAAASGTAYNLLADELGIPSRCPLPDRGEPIPYLVDTDFLPPGVTQAQALQALSNALAAMESDD